MKFWKIWKSSPCVQRQWIGMEPRSCLLECISWHLAQYFIKCQVDKCATTDRTKYNSFFWKAIMTLSFKFYSDFSMAYNYESLRLPSEFFSRANEKNCLCRLWCTKPKNNQLVTLFITLFAKDWFSRIFFSCRNWIEKYASLLI